MQSSSKNGAGSFSTILNSMNAEGGFPVSVLTDIEGFPIASATTEGRDPDKQAALVALVQRTANQVRTHLGMGLMDEIMINDTDGQRLVCRMFCANKHNMILAVIVPGTTRSYRRVTNTAIQAIHKIWEA